MVMMKINSKILSVKTEFIYHNVGQGLFYSGEIRFPYSYESKFRFIYDCGSENIRLINASIHKFKRNIEDNKINLLILSHLHLDHVSGLEELFNNFIIKEVILPYFTPIERLLIALRRINMPVWYYHFLFDPVAYLFQRGVERVIVLGGEEGSEGDVPPEKISPSPPGKEFQRKLNIEKLPDDKNLEEKITQYDENWKEYIKKNKLLIKNHNGYILAFGLWLFRFFNYKIPLSKFSHFKKCLSTLNIRNNEDIKRAIKDTQRLKDLKKCYNIVKNSLKNDFNNTSLILYHGPVGKPRSEYEILCFCPCCFCNLFTYCFYRKFFKNLSDGFGQFLTGDINLNMNYDELRKHYTFYLKNILITQVPHHGARKNWNKNIITDLPNSYFWIISSGLRNRYRHPSYRVIENICLNEKKCLWINELTYTIIRAKIIW